MASGLQKQSTDSSTVITNPNLACRPIPLTLTRHEKELEAETEETYEGWMHTARSHRLSPSCPLGSKPNPNPNPHRVSPSYLLGSLMLHCVILTEVKDIEYTVSDMYLMHWLTQGGFDGSERRACWDQYSAYRGTIMRSLCQMHSIRLH